MQLQCKQCGAPIEADNINVHSQLAVCSYCNSVFHFGEELIPAPSVEEKRKRRKIKTPKRMEIIPHDQGTEIKYNWFSSKIWGMVSFAVFWDGFLVVWIAIALSAGALEMAAFSIIHILVGFFITYHVVTTFLNETSIMIEPRGVVIQHGPLPTYSNRNKVIDRRSVEQVYCKRRVRYSQNDVPVYCFDVHLIVKGEEPQVLVNGLDNLQMALFIEQQIEQEYLIKDEPVSGEYTGKW